MTAVLIAALVMMGIIVLAQLHAQTELERHSAKLWQHIEVLEGDKRALTESLCRAQGKPYIRAEEKRDLVPSEGWWDAATRIEVKN